METINYKGFEIGIEQDEDPENPREWDNLGTMICYYRGYSLGDKHDFSSPEELMEFIDRDNVISLPLFVLDHSMLRMSTNYFNEYMGWDTSKVGYIYAEYKTIREAYGVKRVTKKLTKRVKKALQQEVETYDNYLGGDVWGYTIPQLGESCWGYYGADGYNYAVEEAKEIIDYHIKELIKKRIKYLKGLILNNVPLIYRKPFRVV